MLTEPQLENAAQRIDHVRACFFARAALAVGPNDLGHGGDDHVPLAALVDDRQMERFAHASNGTPTPIRTASE